MVPFTVDEVHKHLDAVDVLGPHLTCGVEAGEGGERFDVALPLRLHPEHGGDTDTVANTFDYLKKWV